MKPYLISAAIASVLTYGTAFATTTSATNTDPAATLVTNLTKGQATIVKSFDSVGNLEGFVLKPVNAQEGQPTIIYADKNGQYAFVGALLNGDGSNQSAKDNQQYIVSSIAKNALADAKNTAWVLDGNANARHMVYVVADPNCIYCNKFYNVTRSYVKSGDLAIRWIWVGFLKDTSPGLAQAILASNDPNAAIAQDETKFNESNEQGGIKPLTNPSKEVMEKYKKNMAFLSKYQFPGTPVLIYQDQNNVPQAAFGLPTGDELTTTINSMNSL